MSAAQNGRACFPVTCSGTFGQKQTRQLVIEEGAKAVLLVLDAAGAQKERFAMQNLTTIERVENSRRVTLIIDPITSRPVRRNFDFRTDEDKDQFCADAQRNNTALVIREEKEKVRRGLRSMAMGTSKARAAIRKGSNGFTSSGRRLLTFSSRGTDEANKGQGQGQGQKEDHAQPLHTGVPAVSDGGGAGNATPLHLATAAAPSTGAPDDAAGVDDSEAAMRTVASKSTVHKAKGRVSALEDVVDFSGLVTAVDETGRGSGASEFGISAESDTELNSGVGPGVGSGVGARADAREDADADADVGSSSSTAGRTGGRDNAAPGAAGFGVAGNSAGVNATSLAAAPPPDMGLPTAAMPTPSPKEKERKQRLGWVQFYVMEVNKYGFREGRSFGVHPKVKMLEVASVGDDSNTVARPQQYKLSSLKGVRTCSLGPSTWHQRAAKIHFSSKLSTSDYVFIFEADELEELRVQLLAVQPTLSWQNEDDAELDVERWQRFDVVKVNKAGLRKRRTLLLSQRQHMIHTFKPKALVDGVVSSSSSFHKSVPLNNRRLQLERSLAQPRELHFSRCSDTVLPASRPATTYIFSSACDRERFVASVRAAGRRSSHGRGLSGGASSRSLSEQGSVRSLRGGSSSRWLTRAASPTAGSDRAGAGATTSATKVAGHWRHLYIGTFNVGGTAPPDADTLRTWIDARNCDLYVLSFQECEKGNDWASACVRMLNHEHSRVHYSIVASVNLWEIHLCIIAARRTVPLITNLETTTVATGIGIAKEVTGVQLGNKGAAVASLRWGETSLCFVGCHMAARPERVRQREEDYRQITARARVGSPFADIAHQFEHLFWVGDVNYRVDLPFEDVKVLCSQRRWDVLQQNDQLVKERQAGRSFIDFEEAPLNGMPSYRWARGEAAFSNKRQQSPSYCDRVLWRSLPAARDELRNTHCGGVHSIMQSDHRPIAAHFDLFVRETPALSLPRILQALSSATALQAADVLFRHPSTHFDSPTPTPLIYLTDLRVQLRHTADMNAKMIPSLYVGMLSPCIEGEELTSIVAARDIGGRLLQSHRDAAAKTNLGSEAVAIGLESGELEQSSEGENGDSAAKRIEAEQARDRAEEAVALAKQVVQKQALPGLQLAQRVKSSSEALNADVDAILAAPEPGARIATSPDGTKLELRSNGSRVQRMPNGVVIVAFADAQRVQLDPSGARIAMVDDGNKVQFCKDGTVILVHPDKRTVEWHQNGTTNQRLDEGIKVQVNGGTDGATFITLQSGIKVVCAADGVAVVTLPNGERTMLDPNGIVVLTRIDTSTLQLNPTGVMIERAADGTTVQTNPDGVTVTKRADGSVVQREQDGTRIVRTKRGSVTQTELEPKQSVFEWEGRGGRQQLKPFVCDISVLRRNGLLLKCYSPSGIGLKGTENPHDLRERAKTQVAAVISSEASSKAAKKQQKLDKKRAKEALTMARSHTNMKKALEKQRQQGKRDEEMPRNPAQNPVVGLATLSFREVCTQVEHALEQLWSELGSADALRRHLEQPGSAMLASSVVPFKAELEYDGCPMGSVEGGIQLHYGNHGLKPSSHRDGAATQSPASGVPPPAAASVAVAPATTKAAPVRAAHSLSTTVTAKNDDNNDGVSRLDQRRATIDNTDPTRLQMSGFLHKRGNLVKTWHRRWFAVHGGELWLRYYHTNMGGHGRSSMAAALLGQISLQGAEVEDREDQAQAQNGKYSNRFAVITQERELVISAESPQEKEDWMLFLRLIIGASTDAEQVSKRRTLLQMAHHPNVRHMSRSLSNGSVETPFRPSSGRQGQGGEEVVTVFGTELEMLAEDDEDDEDDADSGDDDGHEGDEDDGDGDYASSDADMELEGEFRRMPISALALPSAPPAELDVATCHAIASALADPRSGLVGTHKYHARSYADTFVASEAITHVLEHLESAGTRQFVTKVLQRVQELGMLQHCVGTHPFADNGKFFCFCNLA